MSVPADVLAAFGIAPDALGGAFASGHIHGSWAARIGDRAVVVQRLSTAVFPDPDRVIRNGAAVAAHVEARAPGFVPVHVPDRAGRLRFDDVHGHPWRVLARLPGRSREVLADPGERTAAAAAFGRLQALLAGFAMPGPPAIEGFVDPRGRAADFAAACAAHPPADADEAARVAHCAALADTLVAAFDGLERGIIHADAKPSNVLVEAPARSGAAPVVRVIDLDTVLEGPRVFDLADLVRSAAITGREDGGGAELDRDRLAGLVRGFVDGLGDVPFAASLARLPECCACVAWMLGSRFLADHLRGDVYFRVGWRGQNLARAATQLALATALLDDAAAIRSALRRA